MMTFSRPSFALPLLALLLLGLGVPAPAGAELPGPGWEITSTTYPTNLVPSGSGTIYVQPLNVGAKDSSGQITITDTLPPGITATDAGTVGGGSGHLPFEPQARINQEYWECSIAPGAEENSVVTCHNNEANMPSVTGGAGLPASYLKLHPNEETTIQTPIAIVAQVGAGVGTGTLANQMTIAGGGATTAVATSDPIAISPTTPEFGLARWDGWFSNRDGSLDTRAGSVPYSFTTDFDFNTVLEPEQDEVLTPGGDGRNYQVVLPPGLLGNPGAVAQCTRHQLEQANCPANTIVGEIEPINSQGLNPHRVIFNMVPPHGQAAQFAFTLEGTTAYFDPVIRSGGDYGITTWVKNAPQRLTINSLVTFWGVPNDPSHLPWHCSGSGGCSPEDVAFIGKEFFGPHPSLKPFLRLPTSCLGPQPFTIAVSPWSQLIPEFTEPLAFFTHDAEEQPTGLDECNSEPFEPTVTAKPTTNVADAPSGLEFDLHIHQPEGVRAEEEEIEGEMRTVGGEPEQHEADLKNVTVTLPKGLVINPSSGNGLEACTPAQIGLTSTPGQVPVTMTPAPGQCPNASKIGSVEVDTPLLDHPIEGGVYVAQPQHNPFDSLLAIYLAVNDPQTGTVVKLAGEVKANPDTGQLETVFANNPQLPFEDFHLNFFKGAEAALRTSQTCGTFQTTTDMTPWSTPEGADAFPTDSFAIAQSPSEGTCPTSAAQLPDKPNFEAGTIQPKAGAYSPFVLHLARQDGSQEITGIDTTLPEGLIGKLAGVSECTDAQIAQAEHRSGLGEGALEQAHPSCPANSLVGKVSVGAGAGPAPYYTHGNAYLAGPYKGASLSLEIITPAVAGPYDLGAVAVRTALFVSTETAQIHAVSDQIPHILQGIPLDVRSIDLSLDRNQFTLNPTSCAKKQILGTATSALGQGASLLSPFQVGDCAKLGFAPKLAISLKGKTSRGGTPALSATVTYPSKGAYANIAKASVALPASEYLANAHIRTICTRVQFAEGNTPGEKCPPGSIYGHAKAITPLLDQPVEGPVYLRSSSHELPDLVAALDGQIDVVLDGTIDSVHRGIRNRFEVVPDAPVSKFTLNMQGGKKGLLENSTDLCKSTNRATAKFTAQNGLVSESRPPVIATGCKGGKAKKHKHRKGHGAG